MQPIFCGIDAITDKYHHKTVVNRLMPQGYETKHQKSSSFKEIFWNSVEMINTDIDRGGAKNLDGLIKPI